MIKEKQLIPELVAPAGDWPSLIAAIENGADGIFFGVKGLNMRNLASNFDLLEIKKVMSFLRKHDKKGYLTLNIVAKDSDIAFVQKILQEAKKAKVDAVILWDMAILSLTKKIGLDIHLSTQASVSNLESIKLYVSLGVKRIVLARECTLADIKKIIKGIKKEKVDCEIETFIHGAMCVSISGRCFMSELTFDKSANRGECLQPCRREFVIKDVDNESEYILGKDYVLSPKDLCSIDFIDDLIKAKIHCFKIEGRMRSPEYIGVTTSVYRKAMDAYFNKKLNVALKVKFKKELQTVYNRGFSSGFYFGMPSKKDMSKGLGHSHEKVYVGDVKKFYKKLSVADIRIRTKEIKKGDMILFLGAKTPGYRCKVLEIQSDHHSVQKGQKGDAVGIKLPFIVRPKDKVFLWKKKKKI